MTSELSSRSILSASVSSSIVWDISSTILLSGWNRRMLVDYFTDITFLMLVRFTSTERIRTISPCLILGNFNFGIVMNHIYCDMSFILSSREFSSFSNTLSTLQSKSNSFYSPSIFLTSLSCLYISDFMT